MILNIFVLAGVLASALSAEQCTEYNQVNNFIASGGLAFGYGGINPGAQLPFSPMRLGPDTTDTVIDMSYRHFSGYNYDDKIIRGFSHTHLVGGGVNDLGSFGVMPTVVSSSEGVALPISSTPYWWSSFNKKTENAAPGRYSVHLTKPEVDVDLLAVSSLAGLHKYRWNRVSSDKAPALIIDLCHASKYKTGDDNPCASASVTIDPSMTKFTGTLLHKGGLSGSMTTYVSGEIEVVTKNAAIKSWQTCTAVDTTTGVSTCTTNTPSASSTSGILYNVVEIGSASEGVELGAELEVQVRMGISFISEDLATQNLQVAFKDSTDFNRLSLATKNTWCNMLNQLQVTAIPGVYPETNNNTATDEDLNSVIHSAHYRSLLSPTSYTETGGLYFGMDKKVHNVTAERLATYGTATGEWYSDFSLWDTFRSQHPWMLLRDENYAIEFARSMIEMTAQQNAFPRWPLGSNEASCMIGESGLAAIVEPLLSRLGGLLDVKSIYSILTQQWTTPWPLNGKEDVQHYMDAGYVSEDVQSDATCKTLTNAYDDYLLGKVAEYQGDQATADASFTRSKNYAKVWSPESQLFCPKWENGTMVCPKSGNSPWSWTVFREGDANHWAWFVPHDVQGLISLFPSVADYNAALDTQFEEHVKYFEKFGNAVPNPYYWPGNEHSFFIPWMFNFAGNCTRTQYWVRRVAAMHFTNTPHGIPGNEDYGSMASWAILANLGLFPQAGTTTFQISSPTVLSANLTIHHATGRARTSTLKIVTYNNNVENTYIEKLLVNGKEYTQPSIDRSVLTNPKGCTLEFYMTNVAQSGLCAN